MLVKQFDYVLFGLCYQSKKIRYRFMKKKAVIKFMNSSGLKMVVEGMW